MIFFLFIEISFSIGYYNNEYQANLKKGKTTLDFIGFKFPISLWEITSKKIKDDRKVPSIYVMKLILEWIKEQGGIPEMQFIAKNKSDLLYNVLDNSEFYEIINTNKIISDEESPLNAAKKGEGTSMWNAIDSQKKISLIKLSEGLCMKQETILMTL